MADHSSSWSEALDGRLRLFIVGCTVVAGSGFLNFQGVDACSWHLEGIASFL